MSDQAEPQTDEQLAAQDADPQEAHSGVPSISLSDNLNLDKLPLVPTDPNTHAQDRSAIDPSASPSYETTPAPGAPAPKAADAAPTSPSAPTALFATQKDAAPPTERSSEAEAIRNEPVPANLKGKAADSWNAAKTKWAGIVEAKEAQLRNFTKENQGRVAALLKENESMAQRISHLSGYESAIDYQSSEKFQKSYDEPLKQAETGLIEFAKGWATPEGLKELQDNIGDRRYLINALSQIEKGRPDLATEFRLEMQKVLDSRRARDNAINDAKSNHGKFVEERRAESTKKQAQFQEATERTVAHFSTLVGDDKQTPQFPFLVKQRAPTGASPELIAQVDNHNKFVDDNLSSLKQVVRDMDSKPEERVRMAVGYMTAVVQANQIKQLSQQLAQAQELINRTRKASTIPEKASGGVMPGRPRQFQGSLSEAVDALMPR